jgi:hypothetical protein
VAAPEVAPGAKWCRSCEKTKSVSEFAGNRSAKDGFQAHCRECQAQRYREKREARGELVRPRVVPEGSKFCRTCRTIKPLTEWSRNAHASDGYQTRCKPCTAADARRKYFEKAYGMSEADVIVMREAQGGVCAICRTAPAVHVDHSHETGTVRGMLCFSCNAALGHFRDDPTVLRRAARYLETYAAQGAPGPSTSHRDEVAWEIVFSRRTAAAEPGFLEQLVPAGGPSRLERLFAARLAEHRGGPAS